ncbi:YbhN family protein [Actinoplanes sp. NPDC051851]|uniref:lysylphosphatidylglycerol synthase transmembrane domain-containing protein n=1 Tax=Actinoplanes sp. NPDC051851 TaxID=3154753 RepID=UPI00343C5D33
MAKRVRAVLGRWPMGARLFGEAATALDAIRGVPVRYRWSVLGWAVLNWTLDLACLFASTSAFGLDVHWERLAVVYLTVQVVRQVPLTPGGIGVIEAGLLAGLAASGAPTGSAAAVVLAYRLVSFWLLLPVGLLGYVLLRTRFGEHSDAPVPTAGMRDVTTGVAGDSQRN